MATSEFVTEGDLDKIDAATKAAINSVISEKLAEVEKLLKGQTSMLRQAQAEVQRLEVEYKGLERKLREKDDKLNAIAAATNGA